MKKLKERFWYESDVYFRWIESLDNLRDALKLQMGPTAGLKGVDEFLDKSRQNIRGQDFGTRHEHYGDLTLRMYLKEIGELDNFLRLVKS